ncbi:MAG: ROK family protein [Candidatus Aenigmatarchaeota archaeon]
MTYLVECYDVGGTNIRGALIKKNGTFVRTAHCRTARKKPLFFIEQIAKMSKLLRNYIPSGFNVISVSIALPGPVKNNILVEAPAMKIKGVDVAKKLSKKIKEPIFLINDMKAAARAELKFGVGKKTKNFYIITISTGIGSGLVINGKTVDSFYGEFGHDILERYSKKAKRCNCGRKGCWVAMSSGLAVEKMKKKNMSFNDFYRTNKKAVSLIRDYNAQGIGNMLNAFSVDTIVIMGSMGVEQFKRIIPSRKEIEKYTLNKVPSIVPTKLGDTIGLLGAYIYALEKMRK